MRIVTVKSVSFEKKINSVIFKNNFKTYKKKSPKTTADKRRHQSLKSACSLACNEGILPNPNAKDNMVPIPIY